MNQDQNRYLFDDAADAPEFERLQLLEAIADGKTREWLSSHGPLAGRRCLEVGAGAGSIAAWLASEVGPAGQVMAVDINARFLRRLEPQVQVVEGQLGAASVPAHSFDLAHARYVLIHNADPGPVIDEMLRALKPGGTVLLEDPDFSVAKAFTGPAHLRRSFDNVTQAIRATFATRHMDYAFGASLATLLEQRGARIEAIDYECEVTRGGDTLAEMARRSTWALRDKYIATGLATALDIDAYTEFATSAACFGTYYATVRVLARKQAER